VRFVLFGALLVAGTLSLFNLVRNRRRNLNALALAWSLRRRRGAVLVYP
jgi:hypothetical protein